MLRNKKEKLTTKILVNAENVLLWTNHAEENLNRLNNLGNKSGLRIKLEKIAIQKLNKHRCKGSN